MSIEIYVQARMGSTRLPGKVFKEVLGKSLLDYLVERLLQCKECSAVVILTTTDARDDVIEAFCKQRNIACFRGAEEDVLDRYYQTAVLRHPEGIVRITSDCPLIDPQVIDEVVREFRQHYPGIDYVSNSLQRTYPRGLDVEVFSFDALERVFREAKKPDEREHVTLYMYRHPEKFGLKNIAYCSNEAGHRWTVDTAEDFALVKLIIEKLYPANPAFRLKDILTLLEQHPEWSLLNAHVEQKPV